MRAKLQRIRDQRLHPTKLSADVLEHSDAYTVVLDAPGVEPEDIHVRFINGKINIRAERLRNTYEGFDLVTANRSMYFEAEVLLPEDVVVTPEAGEATVQTDGTLSVTMPKVDAVTTADTTTDVSE